MTLGVNHVDAAGKLGILVINRRLIPTHRRHSLDQGHASDVSPLSLHEPSPRRDRELNASSLDCPRARGPRLAGAIARPRHAPLLPVSRSFARSPPVSGGQESIINMRRKLLVQRFVMALTQGKSSVRPIEMQAHDPVR